MKTVNTRILKQFVAAVSFIGGGIVLAYISVTFIRQASKTRKTFSDAMRYFPKARVGPLRYFFSNKLMCREEDHFTGSVSV